MNSTALATTGPRNAYADTMFVELVEQTNGAARLFRTVASGHLARASRFLRGDHALAQLIRFALVGGASNISYVLLFMALTTVGPLVANIAGSIVSTAIANELHRRLTFHATTRVTWYTAQLESGVLALIGLLVTTAALAALAFWAPGLPQLTQATAVIAIMAAVGAARFLALRGFVF
ncbi:GtrA family protein [Nocardia sp. CDC160]|uniref:GtrA family protein n=1 Tax=Nocardia sp. CDC160 TaxID=3112166 RepID=UPI002DB759C0|nr:GtrA family protein [Nocardia sp. CDC160]MEC3919750.1 GtrA family protein [Nocardia sp. CDC160]